MQIYFLHCYCFFSQRSGWFILISFLLVWFGLVWVFLSFDHSVSALWASEWKPLDCQGAPSSYWHKISDEQNGKRISGEKIYCTFFSWFPCVSAKSLQSCTALCDTMDYILPGSSVHEDSPGKNTGHVLLQGVILSQGSNAHFLRLLYH